MAGRVSYYGGIVKDGLVLDLDAAKRDSYPTTGTTWRDISGNQNNGTLTNGPTFNSDNGGSIVFDGVNDYVLIPTISLSTDWSINTWVKSNQTLGGSSYLVLLGTNGGFNYFKFEWNNRIIGVNSSGGSYVFQTGITPGLPLDQKFFMLTITVISGVFSVYLNTTKTTVNATVNGTININRLMSAQNAYIPGGAMSTALIYNRGLSQTEVTQNYNATKGRYGL